MQSKELFYSAEYYKMTLGSVFNIRNLAEAMSFFAEKQYLCSP